MRMYKVKDDGGIVAVAAKNEAGKIDTTYQISTTIVRDENGNPVDIAVSVTCPVGQHANYTREEKARGMVDSWEAAAKAATEYLKKKYKGANVHLTESRPFGEASNRDEYQTAPSPATVPVPVSERRRKRRMAPQDEMQTQDLDLDTPEETGESEVQKTT